MTNISKVPAADWQVLQMAALEKLNPRQISPTIEAGGVAAAILTKGGNIYTGVCIDTACSLGMCAERNAAANMLTNGEQKIIRMVCLDRNGNRLLPCGACQELLLQLDSSHIQLECLLDEDRIITLGELMPNWWGKKWL